ncbi:aspartate--tRNA ligase, partial [bacterium]|nr:aspartate--tRNA ligase [bacterium]
MNRTHSCGELTAKNVNDEVVLEGWVHSRRDHGSLIFVDIRDRAGLTQIVFDSEVISKEKFEIAETLRDEFVIKIFGKVEARSPETVNKKIDTGEIEVAVEEIVILNKSKTPPFLISDDDEVNENTRLKYRYLDL